MRKCLENWCKLLHLEQKWSSNKVKANIKLFVGLMAVHNLYKY